LGFIITTFVCLEVIERRDEFFRFTDKNIMNRAILSKFLASLIRLAVFFVSGSKSLSVMSRIKLSCVAVKWTYILLVIVSLSDVTIKACQTTAKSTSTARVSVESTTELTPTARVPVESTTKLTSTARISSGLPQLCGQQKAAGGLVFSGDSSRPGQFPWAGVMLWKDTMQPFCGCSLITNEFAITAAHCFYEKNADAVTSISRVLVQFGRNDLSDDDEKGFVTRSIIDLSVHDNWDPIYEERYDADIAIIRFNQTVRFSTHSCKYQKCMISCC